MLSTQPTPSPLIRTLVRTLLALCCISAVLSASAGTGASACGGRGVPRRPQPFNCDLITHLELDFLNDGVEAPDAFDIDSAAIVEGNTAEFRVYAATDDLRFYEDVTALVGNLKFRVRGLKGFNKDRRVRYRDDGDNPRWVLTPARRSGGQTGSFDCAFKCGEPRITYTTRFLLTVVPEGMQPAN